MPAPLRSPELIERVLDGIRRGSPIGIAATNAGVSPRTLREWRQKDPELSAILAAADAGTGVVCWEAQFTAAKLGDVKAQQFIITHRYLQPEEPDEDELEDRASKMFQLGQMMRGALQGPPDEGAK